MEGPRPCETERNVRRTVDGDGESLVENVTVGTLKGRNLSKSVELEVLGWDSLGRFGVNDLKVDVVCLCNCLDSN